MAPGSLLQQLEAATKVYVKAMRAQDDARERWLEAMVVAANESVPVAKIARSAGISRERCRQLVERERQRRAR